MKMRISRRALPVLAILIFLLPQYAQARVSEPGSYQVAEMKLFGKKNAVEDTCKEYRKPLIGARDYVRNKTVQGAFLGALAGAAVVAVGGGGGDDMLKGAVAGALVLGAVEYVKAKRESGLQAEALRNAIDADLQPEMATYSSLATSVQELSECRRDKIAEIKEQVATGVLTREQGLAAYEGLQKLVKSDDELIAAASKQSADRVQRYVAIHSEAEQAPADALLGDVATDEPQFETIEGAPTPVSVAANEATAKPSLVAQTPVTADTILSVMPSPDNDGAIKGTIYAGTQIVVIEPATAPWVKIAYNGGEGYVRSTSLNGYTAPEPTPTPKVDAPKSASGGVMASSSSGAKSIRIVEKAPPKAKKAVAQRPMTAVQTAYAADRKLQARQAVERKATYAQLDSLNKMLGA